MKITVTLEKTKKAYKLIATNEIKTYEIFVGKQKAPIIIAGIVKKLMNIDADIDKTLKQEHKLSQRMDAEDMLKEMKGVKYENRI